MAVLAAIDTANPAGNTCPRYPSAEGRSTDAMPGSRSRKKLQIGPPPRHSAHGIRVGFPASVLSPSHPDGFQTSRRTSNESGENRVASGDAAPRYADWRRFSTRISRPTGFRLHPPGFFIGSSTFDVRRSLRPRKTLSLARMPARSSHPLTVTPPHPLTPSSTQGGIETRPASGYPGRLRSGKSRVWHVRAAHSNRAWSRSSPILAYLGE